VNRAASDDARLIEPSTAASGRIAPHDASATDGKRKKRDDQPTLF
jgi:hypothetical protein